MRMKSLKLFFIGLMATMILAGCAGAEPNEETVETAVSEVEASDAETVTAESEDSEQEVEVDKTETIVISHAFGETVIEGKPERVATISWGNQDLPLALGVVPVGVSKANYGVTDDSFLLPWTKESFESLGETAPVLFDDLAGLNYEAINDVAPDVILAAYSGLTEEEYQLLSEIAPVVAYPENPWQTLWRDQITINATAMGMADEGDALVAELEALIEEKTSAYPAIEGKSAAFFYFNPADLGKFYVYLPEDPRAAYLTDLGMSVPDSVIALAETTDSFALEISAENADLLADVDIMIAYGSDELVGQLQADALVGTIPAVVRGSVVVIEDNTPLAASGTPSALSIEATIDEYLALIGAAAELVQ